MSYFEEPASFRLNLSDEDLALRFKRLAALEECEARKTFAFATGDGSENEQRHETFRNVMGFPPIQLPNDGSNEIIEVVDRICGTPGAIVTRQVVLLGEDATYSSPTGFLYVNYWGKSA